jgi:hypothetical protein
MENGYKLEFINFVNLIGSFREVGPPKNNNPSPTA